MTNAGSADKGTPSPIAKLFTAYAGLHLLLAIASLVRNKVTAVSLGPADYGEFSQILNVNALLVAAATLGMGVALGRGLAVSDDRSHQQRLISSALNLTAWLSIGISAIGLALVFTGDYFHLVGIPEDAQTTAAAAVSIATLPLVCAQSLYIAALQGLLDAEGTAKARGLAITFATIAGVPLILRWGMVGATVAVLLLAAATAVALGVRLRKLRFAPFNFAVSGAVLSSLLSLGIASTVSALAHAGADVVTRRLAIEQLGAHANGLIQAPVSVTALAQGVLLGSVGAISVAVIARAKDSAAIARELGGMIDFVVPFATLGFATIGAFAPWILTFLFSTEFLDAQPLFLPILLFQYTVVLYWIIGSPLLAAGRARLWLGLDLIGAASKVILAVLLIPGLGLIGLPVSLMLFAGLHLALSLAALRSVDVKPPWRRIASSALGAFAIGASTILPNFGAWGVSVTSVVLGTLSFLCYRTFRSHRQND